MSESIEELERRVIALEKEVAFLRTASEYLQASHLYSGVWRDLSVDLFRKLGLQTVEGVPIADWWQAESQKHLETVLIQMEDSDPGPAAYLQSVVDRSTGSAPPES